MEYNDESRIYCTIFRRYGYILRSRIMGSYGDMLPWTVEGVILSAVFFIIIGIGIVFAYHFIKGGRPWI